MEEISNNVKRTKKINIILILGVLAFRISLDYAYKNMICVLYQNYKFGGDRCFEVWLGGDVFAIAWRNSSVGTNVGYFAF